MYVHLHQHQLDVDLHNSLPMKIVKMRTIMLGVTGMVGHVVVTTFQQIIVQIVNVLTQILELSFMKSLLE